MVGQGVLPTPDHPACRGGSITPESQTGQPMGTPSALGMIIFCFIVAVGCEPSGDADSTQGDVLEEASLLRVGDYPCTLTFHPTGTVLRSDLEGITPDPNDPVALGPDGQLATPWLYRGEVALWSPDGTFMGTVGRKGEGPGEFGNSPIPIFDDDGHLHVIDPTQARWSHFTQEGEFLGSLTSPYLGHVYPPGNSAIFGADSVLFSLPSPVSPEPFQFRVVYWDGSTRGFGRIPTAGHPSYYRRAITRPEGGMFWAAPWDGAPEYVFEQWTLDGRVLRRLRREPPWGLPADEPSHPGGLPRVATVAEGPRGELIVLTVVRPPDESNRTVDAMEVWYEVIDPRTPEVLAAQQVIVEGDGDLPPVFGIGSQPSRLGYTQSRDSLGLATIEMVEYRLAPSSSGADPATCLPLQ